MYTRIASDRDKIQAHYEFVVVGSGYGGGIAASRLARAGRQVCLLERGKELIPGEFPETLSKAQQEMQVNATDKHIGSRTGLFDFNVDEDINVLVGCGLGGTSLINANVSLRPEPRVFEDARFPKVLRDEFKEEGSPLQKGYDRAYEMLRPAKAPEEQKFQKVEGLKKSAEFMNEKHYRLDINVNFEQQTPNHVGVVQPPCTNCGDCVSGCNEGSKNTTLMNYLPDAKNHGAEIYTQMHVEYVEKDGDEWLVHYQPLNTGREKFDAPTMVIRAKHVILSAGTLGSSKILLRSKQEGLKTSGVLGHRFSGNGDVLGFAYNTNMPINGIGAGTRPINPSEWQGPCITSVIDMRFRPDLDHGMIIEDAVIPGAISKIVPMSFATAKALMDTPNYGEDRKKEQNKAERESLLHGAYTGAVKNSQTYLVMSHDGANGNLEITNKHHLRISWDGVGQKEIFDYINDNLAKATEPLEGVYVKNPIWSKAFKKDLITVHPLGGCVMGEDASEGVTNPKGQVYSSEDGTDVYDNLYVMDGAVIPRALGVNPLITISAVAERNIKILAEEKGWDIDYDLYKHKEVKGDATPPKVGIQFTETMKGYVDLDGDVDYKKAYKAGKKKDQNFAFTLTVTSEDVDQMIDPKNKAHNAEMIGTVDCPVLSPEPITVTNGIFNLFVDYEPEIDTKRMIYNMDLNTQEGETYYFSGYKQIHDDFGFDMWKDTTTLFITICKEKGGEPIGKGILKIKPTDFMKQMTTMKAINASSKVEQMAALAKFGKFFSNSLMDVYGGIFSKDILFNPECPRTKRELRLCDPEIFDVTTDDNYHIRLTRYNGGDKASVMLAHPFNSCGRLWNVDTIDTNLVEYLYASGYDVWLLDYRLSIDLPYTKEQMNLDQIAQYDFPAAAKKIKEVAGVEKVHVVSHCVGSLTAQMAVLKGCTDIGSVAAFQVSLFPESPLQVMLKTELRVPTLLKKIGIGSLNAYTDADASFWEKVYNRSLKVYGAAWGYDSDSAVYNRLTFMFGPQYEMKNVNELTNTTLHETFGIANMTTYTQLTKMLREERFVDHYGEDTYIPEVSKMKNVPITLIAGEKNQVFKAKNVEKAVKYLKKENGGDIYKAVIIDGYGHTDCVVGKNAAYDVYPHILEHLEKYAK
ncbi:MAG: choline dehydrogenase [Cytophagales bacterium]|nr:choline dehydrogenase [Cytophagales bacterium]